MSANDKHLSTFGHSKRISSKLEWFPEVRQAPLHGKSALMHSLPHLYLDLGHDPANQFYSKYILTFIIFCQL
jgi:hypothetical protein